MTAFVVANSMFMLLYRPREPNGTGINQLVEQADFVFNFIFLIELILQVVATGVVVPDPNEGHQTDVYTIRDVVRSRCGRRAIPRVAIGNISSKARRDARRFQSRPPSRHGVSSMHC